MSENLEKKKDMSIITPQTKGWTLVIDWNSGSAIYGLGDLELSLPQPVFSSIQWGSNHI